MAISSTDLGAKCPLIHLHTYLYFSHYTCSITNVMLIISVINPRKIAVINQHGNREAKLY